MMPRIAILLLAGLALAGCQTGPTSGVDAALNKIETGKSATLTATQIEAVKSGVKRALKDPDSAKFDSAFKAATDSKGTVTVCGYVNAKNSFGGFTGNQPFVGSFADTKFVAIGVGGKDTEIQATQMFCAKSGIYL